MTHYQFSSSSNMAFRSGFSTTYPVITNTGNTYIQNGYVKSGTKMLGDSVTTISPLEQWLHIYEVGGISSQGFICLKMSGVNTGVLVELPDTTVPPVDITITSVTLTPRYSDGTIGTAVDYFPKV